MKLVLIILTGLIFTEESLCQGHYGKEFIFGIPRNGVASCPKVLITIASRYKGTYNLRTPFQNLSKTGSFENITEIELNCGIAKNGNFTDQRGIYLNTSHEVSVYVTNYHKNSAESFLVLPVSQLGQHYGIAAYKPTDTRNNRFIMVDATSYSTRGQIYDEGTFHNFTLQRLGVFQFTTASSIQNMSVSTDNPVTVITGTTCTNIPHDVSACDVIIEQMIPFQSLDTIYIAPPTPPKEAYELKVTHFNNSVLDKTCFYNSSKEICTNNPTFSIRMGTTPTVISSNKSISVVQFGFGNGYPQIGIGDPFMTVIQGLKNFLNSYTFAIPRVYNSTQNHISITIPTMNLYGLVLDGSNLSVSKMVIFNVSAPLESYTVFILTISVGYHHIYHVNNNVKFGLLVYGLGAVTDTYVGFGYPGGMQLSMFENSSASTAIITSSTKYQNASITPDTSSINSVSAHPFANCTPFQADTTQNNDTDGNETSLQNEGEKSDRKTLGIALGAVFGSLALLILVGCLLFFVKRKKMRKSSVQPETEVCNQSTENLKNEDGEPLSESVKDQDDDI